ncbi:MAG: hypothetical protein LUH40_01300 [Clostridiales bacterium]|nr:hypothetical protein [Clostridiales bacterium]
MLGLLLKRLICLLLSLLDIYSVSNGGTTKYMQSLDVCITINKCVEYQEINGFGSSACWWAQNCGNSEYADEVAELLYSEEGLGLNIYRYNIGGGEKDNPNSRITGDRATESFYYYNEETGQYEYDFTRDAGAQEMLQKCLSYGCIDTVVLFANSPHYSMTVTGQATGGTEEYQSNLPEENYEAYADYFLTITQYFLDQGVPVKYISPINEPQWSWGGSWVGQEGCHYEPDEVVALLKVFAREIEERGMDVKLMAPESGEIGDTTVNYFNSILEDDEITSVLGSLAYHSYWSDTNTIGKTDFGEYVTENYQDLDNITVDMTEWCELPCSHSYDDFDSALLMARVISQDLALSNANSWTSWVAVNKYSLSDGKMYSDGMLVADEDFTELYTAMRYYAMAHYSKFIPAGSVRIKATSDVYDLTAISDDGGETYSSSTKSLNFSAFKTPEGKIVCVLVNEGEDRNAYLNILGCHMSVWTSTAEAQMVNVYDGIAKANVALPAGSITTVVYG